MDEAARRHTVAEHLRWQSAGCYGLGSPLYGKLLELASEDCEAGGVTWSILEGHEDHPAASALALRFMGSVHRLVLSAEVPRLAHHYPSAGGAVASAESVWPIFCETLREHRDRLRELIQLPVQTNEVGRSASLFGGFLTVARETELPLRLLELGASAGLNLRWDQYCYETPSGTWGDPASPVRFADIFADESAPVHTAVSVQQRIGCDASPVDPCSASGQLTLRAYLWPDQVARYDRLNGALEVARRVAVVIERADAREWLERQLAHPIIGSATVVFHSIVMQYLGRQGATRVAEIIEAAGRRATAAAPVGWLRLEPVKDTRGGWEHRVFLTTWPGGDERVLAISSPHGPPVRWLAATPAR